MNDCLINTGGITPMKLNLNAPFFQFINTAFDFVILNICFILTCLPVFTIGAALTALYTVTMAEAEDKGLPFTKTYFHTFTRCFIRSSLLFAGCICIGALLLFCLFFWLSFESLLALIPSVLSLAALIALVICLIMFGFNFIGDGLRDALDPKLKK